MVVFLTCRVPETLRCRIFTRHQENNTVGFNLLPQGMLSQPICSGGKKVFIQFKEEFKSTSQWKNYTGITLHITCVQPVLTCHLSYHVTCDRSNCDRQNCKQGVSHIVVSHSLLAKHLFRCFAKNTLCISQLNFTIPLSCHPFNAHAWLMGLYV